MQRGARARIDAHGTNGQAVVFVIAVGKSTKKIKRKNKRSRKYITVSMEKDKVKVSAILDSARHEE